MDLDAPVEVVISVGDSARAIGRPIIDDNDFITGLNLIKRGVDRAFNVSRAVIRRDNYGNGVGAHNLSAYPILHPVQYPPVVCESATAVAQRIKLSPAIIPLFGR